MVLNVGSRLGPYEILAPIGAGGMGEVYKARDTRLDRVVAIKVAKEEFSQRFEQEARTIAALNHPNICQLYDVGPNYVVMEYVDGVRPSKLDSPRQLLDFSVQMADGLAAAHTAEILHRDLKPSNILVTRDGRVKILDFGLAKSTGVAARDATAAITVTQPGAVVGTAAYMSPEQAQGAALDHRSDQFSLGLVLYELAAGRRAFERGSVAETMAAIIREEPQPLPAAVPAPLRWVVERCLAKQKEHRYTSTSDLYRELATLRDHWSELISGTGIARAAPPPNRSRRMLLAGAAVLALGAGAAIWLADSIAAPPTGPVLRRLTADSGLTTAPALSRDGKLVAYASDRATGANLDIWVQQVDGGDAVRLTKDLADDSDPNFSPDGTKIAFRSEREGGGIYVVSALGGEQRKIADRGRQPRYSPDGQSIVFWTGMVGGAARDPRQVFVVAAAGGPPRRVAGDLASARSAIWSPDGSHLLCLGSRQDFGRWIDDWWAVALDGSPSVPTGASQVIARRLEQTSSVEVLTAYRLTAELGDWLPGSDRVLTGISKGDSVGLWSIQIPLSSFRARDTLEHITSGAIDERFPSAIRMRGSSGKAALRIAFAGTISGTNLWTLPLDTNRGKPTGAIHAIQEDLAQNYQPAMSADGRYVVFTSNRGGGREVRLRDLQSGAETTITQGTDARVAYPILNADGSLVAYRSTGGKDRGTFLVAIGPGGRPGVPQKVSECCAYLDAWSSDGKWFLFTEGSRSVTAMRVPGGEKITAAISQKDPLYVATFSPDDRWITFSAITGPGRTHLWVAPFREVPVPESEWISISDGPAIEDKPHWSPNGALIYFASERDGSRCLWAQRLDPGTKRPVGEAFAVAHFHSARRSPLAVNPGSFLLSVARDKIVFNQQETTGNIWMATFESR